MRTLNRNVVAVFVAWGLQLTGCAAPAESERPAAGPVAPVRAGLTEEAQDSAQEAAARSEAAKPVEMQSAEHQRSAAQADALALRTAIATERGVLAQLKGARSTSAGKTAAELDSQIAAREQRIAEHERELNQVQVR